VGSALLPAERKKNERKAVERDTRTSVLVVVAILEVIDPTCVVRPSRGCHGEHRGGIIPRPWSEHQYRAACSFLLLLPILLRDNEQVPASEPTPHRPTSVVGRTPHQNACLRETRPDAAASFPSPEHDVTKQFSLRTVEWIIIKSRHSSKLASVGPLPSSLPGYNGGTSARDVPSEATYLCEKVKKGINVR
jgi:hypothetical protein